MTQEHPASPVPDGHVVVPREPSEAASKMLEATALLADLHTALGMLPPNALGINIQVYPARTRRDELRKRIELVLYGVER